MKPATSRPSFRALCPLSAWASVRRSWVRDGAAPAGGRNPPRRQSRTARRWTPPIPTSFLACPRPFTTSINGRTPNDRRPFRAWAHRTERAGGVGFRGGRLKCQSPFGWGPAERDARHGRLRLRSLRHRRGFRGRAGGAADGAGWKAGRGRRGVSRRRHLRHSRLRAQEVHGHGVRGQPRAGDRRGLWLVVRPTPRSDWPKFLEAKDVEIARLSGIYAANLGKAGVELVHGRAVLKDAHTVEIIGKDRTITAEKILIATGGRPWKP